jgi:DeoR family suf operon transcriptional repressor
MSEGIKPTHGGDTIEKEIPILTAHNFVYHDLAIKHPEVCAFDIALLEHLVNRKVSHQAYMAKGD